MKHVKLFEEFVNEGKNASIAAKTLYKTYRKIADLMLQMWAANNGEAMVLRGKAIDHQNKEKGKPEINAEQLNIEALAFKTKRAKKAQAQLPALEKEAESLEKACDPEELKVLKKWFTAKKEEINYKINADWRISKEAQEAYEMLGEIDTLKKLRSAAKEYEKKKKELEDKSLEGYGDIMYGEYNF